MCLTCFYSYENDDYVQGGKITKDRVYSIASD